MLMDIIWIFLSFFETIDYGVLLQFLYFMITNKKHIPKMPPAVFKAWPTMKDRSRRT